MGEEGKEYGKNGIIAVTDYAPYFFIVEIAKNSSRSPSLMFLGSKDLIMKTLWPLMESRI